MQQASALLWQNLKGARPFFLITGPNVLQGEEHALRIGEKIAHLSQKHQIPVVFKSSYDKANRTSLGSYRGPGMEDGLKILQSVKTKIGLPVISDVHETVQVKPAAEVLDILQIPAFLCRQTDLLQAAASTQKIIHIKKGQFAAPQVMSAAAAKAKQAGNEMVMFCERGTTFGYSDLVVDPRGLISMQEGGHPVTMDVTHCLQQPSAAQAVASDGSTNTVSGGERAFLPEMGAMALALGVKGIFVEVDDNPNPPCDGKLQWPISRLEELVEYWKPFAMARSLAGPRLH